MFVFIVMHFIKHSLAIGSFIVDELFFNQISNFHVVAPPPIPRSFPRFFFCFSRMGMWWLATPRIVYIILNGCWSMVQISMFHKGLIKYNKTNIITLVNTRV